ncbi:hypothetical protein N0V90_003017 [Kalmusia sp. IMI 367209]|nr:hypothetical protein N0V90_003017 [Kalmusia sp. IMI 367209]
MKQAFIFTTLVCVSVSHAAPMGVDAISSGKIGERCTNARLDGNWLVGDCLTEDDPTGTTITSGTFLRNKITNNNGMLEWKKEFAPLQRLNGFHQHIGVFSGHLLSDLKGPPEVPSKPSKYPWPSSLIYGVGGNATCPNSPHNAPNTDWCASVANKCTDTVPQDTSEINISYDGPTSDCTRAFVYFNDPQSYFSYSALKLIGQGAWELVGYADEDCLEEVAIIGPEDMGKCRVQHPLLQAFRVRPAFNGDPN